MGNVFSEEQEENEIQSNSNQTQTKKNHFSNYYQDQQERHGEKKYSKNERALLSAARFNKKKAGKALTKRQRSSLFYEDNHSSFGNDSETFEDPTFLEIQGEENHYHSNKEDDEDDEDDDEDDEDDEEDEEEEEDEKEEEQYEHDEEDEDDEDDDDILEKNNEEVPQKFHIEEYDDFESEKRRNPVTKQQQKKKKTENKQNQLKFKISKQQQQNQKRNNLPTFNRTQKRYW